MLDGLEAFPLGEFDVLDGDVILQINKSFSSAVDPPDRCGSEGLVRRPRQCCWCCRIATIGRRARSGFGSGRETIGKTHGAIGSSGDNHAMRQCIWYERGDIVAPLRLTAKMAGKMK